MNVQKLKYEADKIKALLDEPSPGTWTWCKMLDDAITKLHQEWKNTTDQTEQAKQS